MELRHTIIATFLDVTCERIMEALTPLEVVLKDSHEWSIQRMHSLCTKAEDLRDVELLEDAESIRKEFAEWLDPEIEDCDIVSLEYIGEGSEYE
jgi:hypothetical protein